MYYLRFIVFVLLYQQCHLQTLSAKMTAEKNLIATLFSSSYRKDVRPSDTVGVSVKVGLKQIVGLDEKNQIMTTSCYFSQYWTDPRLVWTPNATSDIRVILVPAKNLWMPDTVILNTADTDGYLKLNSDFSYAAIEYTGNIEMVVAATAMKTRCALNMKNYPFDVQTCTIVLASWVNSETRVSFDIPNDNIDLTDFTVNSIWKLASTNLLDKVGGDRVDFEDSSNSEISFVLHLERKPLYYMMNSVFPCLILNMVTLLTFFMPFGNQVGLCMTGFMTFSVYSLRISTDMPVQSDFLPKITVYFILSITYSLITMFWFIQRNHWANKNSMPEFLEKFAELLKKFFCLCYPQDNKTSPEKKTEDELRNQEEGKVKASELNNDLSNVGFLKNLTNEAEAKEACLNKLPEKKEELKCNHCNRCEKCEEEFKKDKDKSKKKKDIESKLEAINYLMLIAMIVLMFTTQIGIWISINQ